MSDRLSMPNGSTYYELRTVISQLVLTLQHGTNQCPANALIFHFLCK